MALKPDDYASMPSRKLAYGAQLQYLLKEFTSLSVELFANYSSSSPLPATHIYDKIADIDKKLCVLLKWLDEHQKKHARIVKLKESIELADSTWRMSMKQYKQALSQLERVTKSNDEDLESIKQSQEANLDPDTVLAYAKLLAPYTSAPPGSLVKEGKLVQGGSHLDTSSRSLPLGAIPPFPTDQAMRQGRLQFRQEAIEDNIGEATAIPAQQAVSHQQPQQQQQQQQQQQHERQQQEARQRLEAHKKVQEDEWELDLDLNPDL